MKLNREQIVKALEEWIKRYKSNYYREHAVNALALIRELTEENERLIAESAKEFTCAFASPHKVADCPLPEEVAKAKADTVHEIEMRLAMHFGTYTNKDAVKVFDVFKLIGKIAEELLKEAQ